MVTSVFLFSVLLVVSILGIVLLLSLKHFELATGRIILSPVRPALGRFFHKGLVWVEHSLPSMVRHFFFQLYKSGRHLVKEIIAKGILWFERTLEVTLHTVREKTRAPRGRGEVSAFLREVADHKRKLAEEAGERAIFDEE